MILKKMKSRLRDKKGATMIEFTISMFIFLMILSLGFEMIMISMKYMQVSNYANDLVRTIAVQGGVDRTAPAGFQGGNSVYKDLNELIEEKAKFAKSVGVSNDDVVVKITSGSSVVNLDSRTPIRIDYLETFEVNIDYKAKSEVTHNFGAVLDSILRRTKMGLSEYLYNYDK